MNQNRRPRVVAMVPTYNERENIGDLIQAILALPLPEHDVHVLVADDNSPDGTGAYVDELSKTDPRVHALIRLKRRGRGSGGIDGFKAALALGAEFVVEMEENVFPMVASGTANDAVIMDPPTYGRGGSGELWKLEDHLWELLVECRRVLADRPLFILINAYTARLASTVVANLLAELMHEAGGHMMCGEIGLPVAADGKVLPCGIYGRWEP